MLREWFSFVKTKCLFVVSQLALKLWWSINILHSLKIATPFISNKHCNRICLFFRSFVLGTIQCDVTFIVRLSLDTAMQSNANCLSWANYFEIIVSVVLWLVPNLLFITGVLKQENPSLDLMNALSELCENSMHRNVVQPPRRIYKVEALYVLFCGTNANFSSF